MTPNIHFIIAWKKIDSADRHHDHGDDRLADHRPQDTTCMAMPNSQHEDKGDRQAQPERHLISVSSHQHTQAPISRNSPCAKFTTCEAL